MRTNNLIQNIHDLFDQLDKLVNAWMIQFQLTPDERLQIHQMLAEHHEHLAEIITDDGTYDTQSGSGVPPLNNQSDQSDQSYPTDIMDCCTPTLSVQVRVIPCLSVQVCDATDCEAHCDC